MTREEQLEAALKQLWGELCNIILVNDDPELMDHFRKTDKRCRELGVLRPVYGDLVGQQGKPILPVERAPTTEDR
jgi:hypothetical protein